jgi:hypothetical protein
MKRVGAALAHPGVADASGCLGAGIVVLHPRVLVAVAAEEGLCVRAHHRDIVNLLFVVGVHHLDQLLPGCAAGQIARAVVLAFRRLVGRGLVCTGSVRKVICGGLGHVIAAGRAGFLGQLARLRFRLSIRSRVAFQPGWGWGWGGLAFMLVAALCIRLLVGVRLVVGARLVCVFAAICIRLLGVACVRLGCVFGVGALGCVGCACGRSRVVPVRILRGLWCVGLHVGRGDSDDDVVRALPFEQRVRETREGGGTTWHTSLMVVVKLR